MTPPPKDAMTAEQRAERVLIYIEKGATGGQALQRIASAIREAEERGRNSVNMECMKCQRSTAYYCRECFNGEIASFAVDKASYDKGFRAGQEEGYQRGLKDAKPCVCHCHHKKNAPVEFERGRTFDHRQGQLESDIFDRDMKIKELESLLSQERAKIERIEKEHEHDHAWNAELLKDRDAWKAKAEKLAGVLRDAVENRPTLKPWMELAKTALAEYDQEASKP